MRTRQPWDEVELAYLREHASTHSWQQIARALGRSTKSVSDRARKMGIYRPSSLQPMYTTEELADMLGVTVYRVQSWRKHGWIRARRFGFTRATIVRFLRAHHHEIDLSRADVGALLQLLLGSE